MTKPFICPNCGPVPYDEVELQVDINLLRIYDVVGMTDIRGTTQHNVIFSDRGTPTDEEWEHLTFFHIPCGREIEGIVPDFEVAG